jgi:hypothetical protein
MPAGTIVYTSGGNGVHTQVSPALATSDATSARVLGWLSESIANNASGLCMIEGYIDGINTQGITEGTQLYLSGTVAGSFQTTKPQAPIHLVYVGVAVKASVGNGKVYVKVQNGYELDEIHDVQIISVANNDLIKYDSATSLWKNVQPSTLSVGTATYAITSGTAVYATNSGTAVYATNSGTAVNISGTVAQSQVTSLVSDLAGKASLGAANAFTVGGHVISNAATAVVPLALKAVASQSANTLELQNSSGSPITYFTASGRAVIGSDSSAMLNVVANSSAVVPVVIKGASGQSANLQEWQSSAGATALSVNSAGLVTGTRAFAVNQSNSGEAMFVLRAAASQTGDQLAVRDSSANTIAGFSATGRLYTGVSGSGQTYLGGLTLGGGSVISQLGVIAGASTTVGAVIRGAASQTANLQEWQDSGANAIASINSAGGFTGYGAHLMQTYVTTRIPLTIKGAASQTADLTQWQNSAGTVVAKIGSAGVLNAITVSTTNGYSSLQEASSGGNLFLSRMTAQAASPGANNARLYLRDGTTGGTLKLVVRAGAAGAETTILDNIPQ